MLATRCMAGLAIGSIFAAARMSALHAQGAPSVPWPEFKASAFRGGPVDNAFFPLVPGAVYVFRIHEGERIALDSITVLRETRRVAGVTATVVHDRVTRANQLVEDTYDWYAQDTSGTVWYLGEDTKEYKAGKVTSTAGSWEAGVAGGKAGVMMPARPRPGEPYRQEYRKGIAEDMARIVSLNDSVTVAAGHFTGCLTTEDWSAIEPGVRERKTYCPRVGLVRERTVAGGSEWMELVAMSKR
jgi:hypothetical protein